MAYCKQHCFAQADGWNKSREDNIVLLQSKSKESFETDPSAKYFQVQTRWKFPALGLW
ncbi:hypothetical protein [Runella slithyformis]|uniref:Uncharacterized protein n=1 Tax=Runella slithyformis (strain ATCC 29530 / DSM 19594 / LMG 11500 / NCIMB 11436 / LSU 4) TaxID=761193 RepID=A0A7U4E696_RUNSL|nr:hypothetical protein [Runella slithyformis]AEI49376.1 hypothetical protein Runsl_2988 [Runella slithyformis DSM 19594]